MCTCALVCAIVLQNSGYKFTSVCTCISNQANTIEHFFESDNLAKSVHEDQSHIAMKSVNQLSVFADPQNQ